MEIKTKREQIERRGPDSESNMRYFKIPLCRNFYRNVRDRSAQIAYECRVQRRVSVTL